MLLFDAKATHPRVVAKDQERGGPDRMVPRLRFQLWHPEQLNKALCIGIDKGQASILALDDENIIAQKKLPMSIPWLLP